MYSTYSEGKSVVAERFIRTLKTKIFKHMAAILKNAYFDVLDDIVDKYNNTVHRTIKMKLIDVTLDSYGEYNEDSNETKLKFKVSDRVRISKYKNTFAKGYTPNQSEEEFFIITKIKDTVPWTYIISEPILLLTNQQLENLHERELQKPSQEKFRIEKVLKRKGDKLYVKWKGYDNFFNSWIYKKDPV